MRIFIIVVSVVLFAHADLYNTLNVSKNCDGDFCIPRIVWTHFFNDDVREDVEEMINSNNAVLKNFVYCRLTAGNLSNFLDTTKFPEGFEKINVGCQSDYIRVCLLEKYGGFYVDSSTYITSGEVMESMFAEVLKKKRSVFGFQKHGVKFLIEMSLIGASERSYFMRKYKEEYDVALKSNNISKYVSDACTELSKNKVYPNKNECGNDAFLVHHVFLKTVEANSSLKADMLMLSFEQDQYYLARECEGKRECVTDRLLHDPVSRAYPFINVQPFLRNGKKFHMGDAKYDPIEAKITVIEGKVRQLREEAQKALTEGRLAIEELNAYKKESLEFREKSKKSGKEKK